MAWKEEAIVDCTMDTLRDSRETYECTTSDRLRDQISVLHLFVLFGWLFVAVCTVPSSSTVPFSSAIGSIPFSTSLTNLSSTFL